ASTAVLNRYGAIRWLVSDGANWAIDSFHESNIKALGSMIGATFVADLTPFAAYKRVRLLIRDLRPATNATDFLMRTSANAGVSYDSAATDYAWAHTNQIMLAAGALTSSGDAADTSIKLSDTTSSAAGFLTDLEIRSEER